MTNDQLEMVFQSILNVLSTNPQIKCFLKNGFGPQYGFESESDMYLVSIPIAKAGYPLKSICTIYNKTSKKNITFDYFSSDSSIGAAARKLASEVESRIEAIVKAANDTKDQDFLFDFVPRSITETSSLFRDYLKSLEK